jgi:Family of unknown function (DUF6454)
MLSGRLSPSMIAVLAVAALEAQGPRNVDTRSLVAERIVALSRDSVWRQVASVPIGFRTFHPQGMVKIGNNFFVSSVEVRVPTKRFAAPQAAQDRDPGEGVGHLFKMEASGQLIADLTLGEGIVYHPGGLDYDSRDIWVPVAEYRPNSRSIVYRVNPETMKATEILRFNDHLGALVHDTDDNSLHGVSWGSRRFYRWALGPRGTNADSQPTRMVNPSHYVDYQDCKYVGGHRMLCTGVAEMRQSADAPPFRLGGLELVDLGQGRPLHQVPVPLWTPSGVDMTHNPVWIEPIDGGLRGYFMPEDDRSTLYVFEVATNRPPQAINRDGSNSRNSRIAAISSFRAMNTKSAGSIERQ